MDGDEIDSEGIRFELLQEYSSDEEEHLESDRASDVDSDVANELYSKIFIA